MLKVYTPMILIVGILIQFLGRNFFLSERNRESPQQLTMEIQVIKPSENQEMSQMLCSTGYFHKQSPISFQKQLHSVQYNLR